MISKQETIKRIDKLKAQINSLEDKKELINLVVDISDLKYTEDELNDNIDNYFDVIKESLYNNQIKKLTSELKNESNSVKKIEIAQRIVDLKMKESNKDE